MRNKRPTYILEYSLLSCTNSYNILPSCFRGAELLQALVCDQGSPSKPLARLPRTFLSGRWPLVRPIMQQCRSILCLLPTRDGSARTYSQRTETRRHGSWSEGVRRSAVCMHAVQELFSCSLHLSSTRRLNDISEGKAISLSRHTGGSKRAHVLSEVAGRRRVPCRKSD